MLSPGHALFFSLLLTPTAAAQSLTFDIDRPVRTIAAEGGFVLSGAGAPATVGALGSDAIADRVLELRGASLPPGQAVLPITSMMESFVPMAGGSAGNLCLGGASGRFPIGFVDGAGGFELGVDITALPAGQGTVSAMAGQNWFFQLWFRDGSSSNFSEAAKVTFR